MSNEFAVKLKQGVGKLKTIPMGWVAAVMVVLVVAFRWGKKVSGLELLGLPADYDQIEPMAIGIALFSVIALCRIFAYVLRKKEFCLHKMYLLCGLYLGTLYMVVLPPLTAPDEWAHYATAYKISNYLVGEEAVDEDGYIMVQLEEMSGNAQARPDAGEYQYYWENYFGKETYDEMIPSNQRGNQTFLASYVPQALGITLARLFNLNFASRILFGRIFNLIWSVFAVSLAIKLMPFGKKMMFAVAMLPMTLHELASNSYDAWIIGFSMLFIAYCMKLAYEKEKVDNRDVAILACLIGLLAPCKIVYAPIIGLCLLIPREKFGNIKRWMISAGIVLGALIVMMLIVNGQTLSWYAEADVTDNYVSHAGEQGYTFTYFLEHPVELPMIMLNTLKVSGMLYLKTMLGWRLGQLDLNLQISDLYFMVLVILVIVFFIPRVDEPSVFRKGNKAWMIVLIGAVAFLTMFSMLVAWTAISSDVITGVQGRYFLPVLPLGALVLFRDGNLVVKRDHEKLLSATFAVYHIFLLAELFGQVLMVQG
ncbi:MAG: DUF2142 domain-containing protein [Lachnospiraceae bacterium]|nr:DUF2142 domain-containing protein [Lachnospiraceae bacterium]